MTREDWVLFFVRWAIMWLFAVIIVGAVVMLLGGKHVLESFVVMLPVVFGTGLVGAGGSLWSVVTQVRGGRDFY